MIPCKVERKGDGQDAAHVHLPHHHRYRGRAGEPENSILFYLALRKAKVPAELHIYEKGPHDVGLAQRDPILSPWPDRLDGWNCTGC